MLPLRLVIDTNVVISAALKPEGLQRTTFLLAITKPARLYVSQPILDEYADVLSAKWVMTPPTGRPTSASCWLAAVASSWRRSP